MIDWQDPQTEASLTLILVKINLITTGVYAWEYVQAFHIEYALIRRRITFRWPLIPYVLGRLSFMISVITFAATIVPVYEEMYCAVTAKLSVVTGAFSIGCSSTNLMIRAYASFCRWLPLPKPFLRWPLAIGLFQGMDLVYGRIGSGKCVIESTQHTLLAVIYLYTMIYDLLVLILTIAGLPQEPPASTASILRRLRRQGLTYCVIVFLANTLPLVFAWLNLDVAMDIFFTMPAACISVITSSRAVLSLLGLQSSSSNQMSRNGKCGEDVEFTTRIGLPT
ncbi:hypothetical protein J3A83DRAFT_4373483 [Scleroderma citrinum]